MISEIRNKLIEMNRKARNSLLTTADTVHCNAEKWESMSEETKQRWREYKQALRDLPETCDMTAPVWPIPPK